MSTDNYDTEDVLEAGDTIGSGWDTTEEILEGAKEGRDAEDAMQLLNEYEDAYEDPQEFLNYLQSWVVDMQDVRQHLQKETGYDLSETNWTEESDTHNIEHDGSVEFCRLVYDTEDREHYDTGAGEAWIEFREKGYKDDTE